MGETAFDRAYREACGLEDETDECPILDQWDGAEWEELETNISDELTETVLYGGNEDIRLEDEF